MGITSLMRDKVYARRQGITHLVAVMILDKFVDLVTVEILPMTC